MIQGYLAHKKHPPRRTLQERYASKPMMTLWGWVFLTSEVPLYGTHLCPDIRGGRDKIVDVFPPGTTPKGRAPSWNRTSLQGHLAHEKPRPHRTLQ